MKTYLLIGAGGTGSHLIAPLCAYLESHHQTIMNTNNYQLVVIDGDNYDLGNTTRQLFDPGFVSNNKAETMALMYNRYPILAVPHFVGKDELANMMNEDDVVLIAADNHSVRALVQDRAMELDNICVINAGNELHDGNVQIFVREDGENKTPMLSFLHPEIVYSSATDRQPMTCQQAAALPGGGQLILANQQAASWMMAALWRFHQGSWKTGWTELQFDLLAGTVDHIDMRERRGWTK